MKRMNNYLVAFTATLAIATSCEKQDLTPTTERPTDRLITIGAVRASDDNTTESRTSITDLAFAWETGDMLGVSADIAGADGELATVAPFTLAAASAGDSQGDFTGNLANPSGEYVYAVYPYDGSKVFTKVSEAVSYTFDLPINQVQNQTDASGGINPESLGKYAYMYGKSTEVITEANKVSPMHMYQVMSVIDFTISKFNDDYKLYSLTLKSNEAMFATTATVNLEDGTVTPNAVAGQSITVSITDNSGGEGVVIDYNDDLTIRLAMFPQTITAGSQWTLELGIGGFNSTTLSSSHSEVITFESQKTFKAGFRYKETIAFDDFDGIVYIPNMKAYPKVDVPSTSPTHSIYVYDRNAGGNVPNTGTNTSAGEVPAGEALNFTNKQSYMNSEWKGDYYTWSQALIGASSNNTPMCADGWRLPTKDEMNAIKALIQRDNSGTNASISWIPTQDGKKCFFPLSGKENLSDYSYGYYWSSTENGNNAYRWYLTSSGSSIATLNKNESLSVRCVKTAP